MTTLNSQLNHTLRKRKGEIDGLTYQMYVYNNPLVNPDKLANQTYNSLIGLALKKHKPDIIVVNGAQCEYEGLIGSSMMGPDDVKKIILG